MNTDQVRAVQPASYQTPVGGPQVAGSPGAAQTAQLPPDWPDARGFIPPPPSCQPPVSCPSDSPVLRHTRIYHANDMEFTEALSSYYFFRDEARTGGWQSYLQRSGDFHPVLLPHAYCRDAQRPRRHGETRVVWRWPTIR